MSNNPVNSMRLGPDTPIIRDQSGREGFRYSELQDGEFRLIRLASSTSSSVECEVFHAPLSRPPSYVAISYAWGDVDDTVSIQLNGCSFEITASLYDALKTLLNRLGGTLLWADAICINHRDKTEQSRQVKLMPKIYSGAREVNTFIESLIGSKKWKPHFTALVTLFERDYWSRLWVVQEVLNVKRVEVYYPTRVFPMPIYILSSHGPASLEFLRRARNVGPESLLEVLHICRKKLAADPRDKVFAVLGILPEHIRLNFPLDYNASIKEVYTNVVSFLLTTTRRFDVICENIYFPIHISNIKLPSWVPGWSYTPQVAALGLTYGFSAARDTNAVFRIIDQPQRTKLEMTVMRLDKINSRGVAVGTFCGLDDLMLASPHWRAKALAIPVAPDKHYKTRESKDQAFCRTLHLDQASEWTTLSQWMKVCYHIFACLFRDCLPQIPLDDELQQRATRHHYDNCASAMMGRCFFATTSGFIGMASGFIEPGDVVCVPLGRSTPVVLRSDGGAGTYRFVSDAYVDEFMYGKALEMHRKNPALGRIYTLE
ncbi:heterokaryon incompatibility protein-domain-containing protein [Xylaria digitata]|nr:heterokaryon incompatibility protein-domain-containing protein [Xylaria digitata]